MVNESDGRKSSGATVPRVDLREMDPFVWRIIETEKARQARKLIFIASESIAPKAVREPMASVLGHIYAEGYPAPRMAVLDQDDLEELSDPFVQFKRYSDRRYYKGTDYMNIIESLARRRVAHLFANDLVGSQDIYANVQPLSGAAANNSVYQAFLKPGDRILGMSLVSGGHLTHGSPVNRSGKTYDVYHYDVGRSGKLDYDAIMDSAMEVRPKIIVAGFSAYPWDIDWKALRLVADKSGALLMADISHTAGLVAAGVLSSPVGLADVVTFTTHKTLCGPRGATILTTDPSLAKKVDMGVFPGEQGGPHMHQIAAKAVAFLHASTDEFQSLMRKVAENAASMAASFVERGMTLAYGGTNTHLFLLDLKKVRTASGLRITGEIASRVLDLAGITCNKNTIAGDKSALHPSGLRFGTTWATQRGLGPKELDQVADLVTRVLREMHSYEYVYAGGRVGRGKVAWDLLKEVRSEVDRITAAAEQPDPMDAPVEEYPHYLPQPRRESGPTVAAEMVPGAQLEERGGRPVVAATADEAAERIAIQDAAALLDLGDCLLVDVSGRRAELFLHSVTTIDVLSLEKSRVATGFVLDEKGQALARCAVVRLGEQIDGRSWTDRFLMRLGPGPDPADTLEFLRALSDGYVYHDEDIYLKAEGPAVLSVKRDASDGPYVAIGLYGPKAAGIWADAGQPALAEVGMVADLDGGVAARCRMAPGVEGVEIYLPEDKASAIWKALTDAGAVPCGRRLFDERLSGSSPEDLLSAGDVALSKPFFVGRKALMALAGTAGGELPADLAARIEPMSDEAWRPVLEVEELPVRRSCLYEEHLELTAKRNIVPFAGWEMPLWYEGIAAEHRAVRRTAGLFDVSHMGVLSVRGKHAERFLDLVTSNYVPWLDAGQCHYSYLLDPRGGVIDDIIVYREARDRFMVVVNAVNAEKDEAWLRALAAGKVPLDPRLPLSRLEGDVEILNLKVDESLGADRRVDIAFQGPSSLPTLLKVMADDEQKRRLKELERFHMMPCRIGDMDLWVARTGYTGESIAYEVFPHPDKAPDLWNLLLDAGKEFGVVPAGLGSRDSTRTEAGLPLWGHELAGPHEINPLESGYAPFVRFHKPFFVGREAMLHAYQDWKRSVVRFQAVQPGGRVIRAPAPVVDQRRGECVGTVTSCVSVDRYQIGLAIVDRKKVRVGDQLAIFPLPHGKSSDVAPSSLEPGSRTVLPIPVTVLRRFMRPGETRESVL